MFKNLDHPSWQWLVAIILFLAFSRLIPHPPNFTPVGAIALLAGAFGKDLKFSLLIPLIAMLLSDSMIGFHSTMLFVYAAVALIVIGCHYYLKQLSFLSLSIAAFTSALVFFAITNFGAWLSHDMYAPTLSGLSQAYIAGIPFFKNTLLSNILFTLVGFYASQRLSNKQITES
ncbi:MAG: DUF6580 family putative transport protein [Gammaproteobacteria bacterium]|nr:DUF6580 family putative transport protein [Gammaproteobacteria bacterium]